MEFQPPISSVERCRPTATLTRNGSSRWNDFNYIEHSSPSTSIDNHHTQQAGQEVLNSTPTKLLPLSLSRIWSCNQSAILPDVTNKHESDKWSTNILETSADTYDLDASGISWGVVDTTRPMRRMDTSADTYQCDASATGFDELVEDAAITHRHFTTSTDTEQSNDEGSNNTEEIKRNTNQRSRHRLNRNDAEIIELYDLQCCAAKCLWDLSPRTISSKEKFISSKNEVDQRQWLLDELHQHAFLSDNEVICNFMIEGRKMCEEAYLTVLNIKKRRLQDVKRLYKDGVRKVIHKNGGRERQMEKTASAIGWMTLNLGNMGDFMPHENKVYLPVCDSKKVYYERMINEIFRDKEKIAYKYFLQLWKKHFANYIVGKPSTFSQCTDCVVLDEHQRKLGTEKERKEAAAMLVMHKKQAEIERRHYHTRRIAAQQNPEEWIAVIIDGMDQSKTDVPHLVKESKSTAGLLRLKTHITGVLVHTDCKEGKEAHVYIDLTEYPHDANLTMNILLDIIVRYRNKPARKIHVQLDNCFRENKNRFVLSLGWLIVELGIFDEVHFSFLPVGHTHEDVDQLFSRISTKIKHTDVYTLDALKDTIHKSYTPNVNVTRLVEVLDIKEWLTPVMENQWGNHSKPHHFLFKRVDGITQMFYRKWVTDSWRPNEEGHDMELIGGDKEVMSQEFKNGIQCMKAVPDMALKPKTVRPFPRKWGFEELEKTIPTSYGERIPEMYRQWWVDFHRSTRLYLEPKQVVETDDITWSLLQLLDRPRKPPELVVENEHLQKIRKRLMEDCPEVFVGKRPTKKKKKQQDIEQKDGEEGADERDDDKVELVENKTYSFDGFVEIGDIVILNLEKYPDEFPLMGQVIEKCDDDEMLIRFYAATGSLKMGQKWSPAFMEEGHRRVPYTEKVTKGSVMLKGFELVEEKVTVNEQMMKALDLLKDMLEKGV